MTSEPVIREATIADVPGMARIRYAAFPWFTASVAQQEVWWRTSRPEGRTLRLVALHDGLPVGWASGGFNVSTTEEGAGHVELVVHPEHRGRGLGSALYDRIEEHLRAIGVRRARAFATEDAPSLRWAQAHGYTQGARDRYAKLDTAVLPPVPALPAGVTVCSLAEAGRETVYDLDQAASIDEPGDMSFDGTPFDVWTARYWESPDQQLDIGTVVMVDGVAACGTFFEANRELGKGMSTGTCTRREYRGRGLAKIAKSVALRRAAEAGIHTAITCNDYTNAPMIAVNDWLGYQPFADEYSYLKHFNA
ncbi:GNAT family N-acetyltransferase [Catellatospora bangladeshensis]|uniref:N-acetyltransferase n=1 Tax=Catellatospora bangladeshensis TaxID=310355 RepID=A0A8J3NM27_9ACTN|nr:GNAT family N-acetyltransferase [Catellatospora bangladeshensis]GIF83210.1 N-acetyltransferase [Catellatospora bangladeshensis]